MSKCIGCGIELQNLDKKKDGYVSNLENNLCERCFNIKYYGKNRNVSKTNIDYMSVFNKIRDNDIVVYVSSLLTLNLNYLNKFNNVILVLTKRDILPKSIKDGKIINYIKNKYNNVSSVFVVSAFKKYNLDMLYNELCKYENKHIYFVGITNSGKSTLINELIKSYTGKAGSITVSNYPSTTLDVVDVNVGKLLIKDTPGLIVEDSIINYMNSSEIKRINSKKEIKPITIQICGSGAILIDDYFRLEYETDKSSMTFYMSNNLNITHISLKNPKFKDFEYSKFDIDNNMDLVIEDIGFIKFTNKLKIKIYYNKKVYMYLRDKLI